MLPIFYLALLIGVAFLAADVLDKLRVEPRRLRWWRGIAMIATLFVGLQPTLFALRAPDWVQFPFHLIAAVYLFAGLLHLVGMATGEESAALWLRRIGYGLLLAVGALPSFLLLLLTPVIALAGIGLVRPVDPARGGSGSPTPSRR